MHRVDSDNHDSNMFQDGDPGMGLPGTVLGEDWHNAVQEEVAAVIEGAGITLSKPDNDQLLAAIRALNPLKVDLNLLSDGVGGVTVESGAGASAVSITGAGNSVFRVTFTDEFAARARVVAIVWGNSTTTGATNALIAQVIDTGDGTTTHAEVQVRDSAGANIDLNATAVRLSVTAYGDLAA